MYEAETLTPETAPADPAIGYKLVRDLIFFQVHSFRKQYGGEIDELVGEANLTFVKTHNQYITGKTPTGKPIIDNYATEISRAVWYRLFDSMRLKVRREYIAKMVHIVSCSNDCHDNEEDCLQFEDSKYSFSSGNENLLGRNDFNFILFQLSKDSRFVIALILDPPDCIISNAQNKGGENRNYRSAIWEYLTDMKWSPTRIDRSFNEIRNSCF